MPIITLNCTVRDATALLELTTKCKPAETFNARVRHIEIYVRTIRLRLVARSISAEYNHARDKCNNNGFIVVHCNVLLVKFLGLKVL